MAESSMLNYTKYRQISRLRLERINNHLDKINKPPVLTIESPDGDLIDCVHKRKQLALDHPLLKNHKIQKTPSDMPKGMKVKRDDNAGSNDTNASDMKAGEGKGRVREDSWQMWHRNGTRCPKGTVPIRRSTVHDVLRAKSLYDYGKKRQQIPLSRHSETPNVLGGNGHEHAIAYTGSSQEIYGAKASISVWDPSIEVMNEFSLSQIWVLSGSFDGPDLNSIEAGWQSDSYQATGCYNLLCAGFIQTNNKIAIGAAISPVSSYAGSQYDISILIWK
ncbi:hypothetical protein TSUD_33140, partial [Trifolium subterraneum]